MAIPYNNQYYTPNYQPIYPQTIPGNLQPPQMATPMQQPIQTPQQSNNGIIWCQGEAGAKSYLVAPGQSVLLMDSENNTFYIKSSDTSGMPQPLRIFDYTERTANGKSSTQKEESTALDLSDYVTREELEARLSNLKEKSEVNAVG